MSSVGKNVAHTDGGVRVHGVTIVRPESNETVEREQGSKYFNYGGSVPNGPCNGWWNNPFGGGSGCSSHADPGEAQFEQADLPIMYARRVTIHYVHNGSFNHNHSISNHNHNASVQNSGSGQHHDLNVSHVTHTHSDGEHNHDYTNTVKHYRLAFIIKVN